MDISFNGINNLLIRTCKGKEYGLYLNNASQLEQGEKYYTIVSLKADLDGNVIKGEDKNKEGFKTHIDQYFEALQKLKHFVLAQKIYNIESPGEIEIVMKHYRAPDNLGEVNESMFIINGEKIPLVHRNILPLYSFMARVTRDIIKLFELPSEIKQSVQLMNRSIADKAEEFIENMNL